MSAKVLLSDVDGISRKSGTDQFGNQWTEFTLDPHAEDCDCAPPECDPDTCPRFGTDCCVCGARFSSGWVCLDGGDECCDDCVEFVDHSNPVAEENGPEEGDYTTTDHIHWYQDGRLVLTTADRGDPHSPADHAYALVKAHMDGAQFWPNAWFISDHGNAHLINL